MQRQAARGLRRLVRRRRDLFDKIHLPAFFKDLLARQRAQAGGALEPTVLAGKFVVVNRRDARRGPRPGRRCGRLRLPRFGIVTDFLPFLPAVALAVHIDRVPDPEDERRQRRRSNDREGERQCKDQTLQFGLASDMKKRASFDARITYHETGKKTPVLERVHPAYRYRLQRLASEAFTGCILAVGSNAVAARAEVVVPSGLIALAGIPPIPSALLFQVMLLPNRVHVGRVVDGPGVGRYP